MTADSACKLQRSFDLGNLGRADSFDLAQFAARRLIHSLEAAKAPEQQAGVIDGALAGAGVAVS